jgi:FtsH-binding integral membrane protein
MNYAGYADTVSYAGASERAAFIRRTYAHLAVAVLAFIAVEWMLLQLPIAGAMTRIMIGGFSGYSWLVVLALFMVVSWRAERWAKSDTSPQMQYLGLGLFVVAEAVVFLPLLYIASRFASTDVIPVAALITGFLFTGLTAVVFATRKDFSWMRMVLFASVAILYDTSQVLHHYRTDQHVAASLSLFASVALLFWYVLRIVMRIMR